MNDRHDNSPVSSDREPVHTVSRREARRMRRQDRWEMRASMPALTLIGGILLIALGAIFLLQNLDLYYFENGWALFFTVPAFGSFAVAWRRYKANGGRISATVRGPLFAGFILTALAILFFLRQDLTYLGPALIILIGVGVIINSLLPQN